MSELVESWRIHDRIHRYLLEGIADAALGAKPGGKGRTLLEQFAHIHNVRLMWLKSAAPSLLEGLEKLEAPLERKKVGVALEESGEAVVALIESAQTKGGKVRGFKPHLTAFVSYLIAHESHHRGQIMLGAKLAGHPVEKKISFGLWEWGTR